MSIFFNKDSSQSLQSLKPDSQQFDEFVYLLQSCMNDAGLFTRANMSRIKVYLPAIYMTPPNQTGRLNLSKRHKFFSDFNLFSRQRYLFFCDDLCLVLDQDVDIYFEDPNLCQINLQRVTRRKHRLLLASSELIRKESLVYSRKDPGRATILNGRAALDTDILRNHQEVVEEQGEYGLRLTPRGVQPNETIRLLIDLPDNLSLFNSSVDGKNRNISILLNVLKNSIEDMPRMFTTRPAREITDGQMAECSRYQAQEAVAIIKTLYSKYEPILKEKLDYNLIYGGMEWTREFTIADMNLVWDSKTEIISDKSRRYPNGISSLNFSYASEIRSDNSKVEAIQMLRSIKIPGLIPSNYVDDEDLLRATELIAQYTYLLHADLNMTIEKIKSCLQN